MTLEQIRARLREIQDRQNAIVAEGDEGLTDEVQTEFDELSAEFDRLVAQETRMVRVQSQQAVMAQSPGRITTPDANPATAAPRIESREMVEEDPNLGFRNLADFAMAVKNFYDPNGDVDPRLRIMGAPSNYHETSGADGYNIPPAMRAQIWELAMGEESLFAAMVPEPTSSNAVDFLRDESTPWGATGIQAYWASEASQFTASRLETEGSTVKLNKLFAFVTATEELMSDAPRLNARLTSGAARAIDWKASESVFRGTGAGQPLGFQSSAALVTVAKDATQAADTIIAINVADIYARCINPGRSFWLVNQDSMPQLLTMTLGDNSIYVPPASGFQNAPGGILFGRPVRFSDHCETLGDAGDIYLINPDGYYAVNKTGGVSFAASIHLYFDYDVQAFRWTFRLGGQPFLSAPVSPNKGSKTRSHFVRVAARA